MPFHLTAIERTKKGPQPDAPRAPQVLASGSFNFCYDYSVNNIGGRSYEPHLPSEVAVGLPVFQSPDWIYYVIPDAFQGQGATEGVKL